MAKPRRRSPPAKPKSRSGTPGAGRERRTYADRVQHGYPTFSFTMPAEDSELLSRIAEERGCSRSELVREGIALLAREAGVK